MADRSLTRQRWRRMLPAMSDERPTGLQHEIRQTRPFRTPSQEAALALLRTADLVRRKMAETIEPHGVTVQQYNVLRILRGAKGTIPTLEIGERMIEQTPGVTRLLDRLEAKGLVARHRCTEDRRRVLCEITPAGRELLAGLDHLADDADEGVVGALDPAETDELIRLLQKIRVRAREE